MQIEETFRDAKSPRFGMSLGYARTRSEDRANVLLLLASLTHLLAVLLGVAAENAQLQRRYQANTVTRKRVLSHATLGRLIAASTNEALVVAALINSAATSVLARLEQAASP